MRFPFEKKGKKKTEKLKSNLKKEKKEGKN